MPSKLLPAGTRGGLLLLMKRQGPVSLDVAEAETGLSRPTLRQHFGQLEREHLVSRSTQKQRRGRPSLLYTLTPGAEARFPSRDGALLGSLLEYLKANGDDDKIQGFFEHYWDERLHDVQNRLAQVAPDDHDGRLAVVVDNLQEQGFMPEVKRNGNVTIRACNCPFQEAVKQTLLPCALEATFYERLFDAPVQRVSYIPDGVAACAYEIGAP